jgi:hypothetical protein
MQVDAGDAGDLADAGDAGDLADLPPRSQSSSPLPQADVRLGCTSLSRAGTQERQRRSSGREEQAHNEQDSKGRQGQAQQAHELSAVHQLDLLDLPAGCSTSI